MTVEAIVTLNQLYIKSILDYRSALQVFDKYWYEVSFYIFRAERRFRKRAFALIDNNNTPYVFVMAINRWLGIRLVSQLITVHKTTVNSQDFLKPRKSTHCHDFMVSILAFFLLKIIRTCDSNFYMNFNENYFNCCCTLFSDGFA